MPKCSGAECTEVSRYVQKELDRLGCKAPYVCADQPELVSYWRVAQEKAQALEAVYPETWLLDAKGIYDLGKLGVRLATASGARGSLTALDELAGVNATSAAGKFYGEAGEATSANNAGLTIGGRSSNEWAISASAEDRGGLSVAGRALQKHGNRDGSAFPSAQGNPTAINEQAQNIVNEILNNPATTATQRNTGRFGRVTDIVAPDGRGLRYDSNGNLIGFLEPPRK